MLLIAGLGNPGATYAKNRHNIGFMAVDEIARRWSFSPARSRFGGFASEGAIETPDGPVKTLILKPQTFYNEAGRAVGVDYRVGDQMLFAREDSVEAAWRIVDPVVGEHAAGLPFFPYAAGTLGPPESDALIAGGWHETAKE